MARKYICDKCGEESQLGEMRTISLVVNHLDMYDNCDSRRAEWCSRCLTSCGFKTSEYAKKPPASPSLEEMIREIAREAAMQP